MRKILITLWFCLSVYCGFGQDKLPDAAHLPEQVGDIIFNPQTDQYDFKLCDKDNIYQYYGLNTSYKGEFKELKRELLSKINFKVGFSSITGSVTVRFIVNCQGQTGWYRIYQLNGSYQKVSFSPLFVGQLLDAVKSLKGWVPGKFSNGTACDTYYYLYFKIVKGHIKDITT
jgi:hypothetical protein